MTFDSTCYCVGACKPCILRCPENGIKSYSTSRTQSHRVLNKLATDLHSNMIRRKSTIAQKKTSHFKGPDNVLDHKSCRKVAVEIRISDDTTSHICHGLATYTGDPLLTAVRPGYTVARSIDLARIHRKDCQCRPPDHLCARRMVTAAGKDL